MGNASIPYTPYTRPAGDRPAEAQSAALAREGLSQSFASSGRHS